MNRVDSQYVTLIQNILELGSDKTDRTGVGTKSIFGYQFRHCMCDGFPLLTTKKMAIKTMMTELKWFLKGDTNIKYLVDNGCNIWNGDAYKAYLTKETMPGVPPHDHVLSYDDFVEKIKTDDEFAKKWGDLGPIYGSQWRDWERRTTREEKIVDPGVYVEHIDQIKNLIDGLKNNPDSRRHLVSAWNVEDLPRMTLPPCHYSFQCYVDGDELSLMWNQRSVDVFLGLPFNIASYGTLLLLLCEETGYKPGQLIGNLGDCHIYNNHIEVAKEQINRVGYELPELKVSNVDILGGEFDYELTDYNHHPTLKATLNN